MGIDEDVVEKQLKKDIKTTSDSDDITKEAMDYEDGSIEKQWLGFIQLKESFQNIATDIIMLLQLQAAGDERNDLKLRDNNFTYRT